MNLEQKKKKIIESFIDNNILVSKTLLQDVENNIEKYYERILPSHTPKYSVTVKFSYQEVNKKITVHDFVGYYNARFKQLESLLRSRQEMQNLTSIARIAPGSNVRIIGMVFDKYITKNNHISLTIEDRSGKSIKVIITKKTADYTLAKDISYDQVIGIVGRAGDGVIFAEKILLPDIPLQENQKKSPDEAYAVLLSDTEFGSKVFLGKEFENFLLWTKGQWGTPQQRAIAKKLGYIFVVGDVVAGIGIYPQQEKELAIHSITEQYAAAAQAFAQIPQEKKLIFCAGNHDSVRLSEPQPPLDKEHASALYALPNATFVSNPSIINIHSGNNFSGFDVLLYHGTSYTYYADTVESIRQSGRPVSDKTELVMEYLLKCRHLAPAHSSALYVPDSRHDWLVIESIPDYILSGHIHKSRMKTYRGVTLLCGSCWQPITQYQKKMGHTPEPCIVPVLGLHDRKIYLFDFKNE